MLLELGTTTYGSESARRGLPSDWWKAVSSWNQGSVSPLQLAVTWPSQSMSMSAFQNTAPFLPHTGMVAEVSSSVLYLPFDICEQDVTLASRADALTVPSWGTWGRPLPMRSWEHRGGEKCGAGGRGEGQCSSAHCGDPSVRKVSLPGAVQGGPTCMTASTPLRQRGVRRRPVLRTKGRITVGAQSADHRILGFRLGRAGAEATAGRPGRIGAGRGGFTNGCAAASATSKVAGRGRGDGPR